MDLPHKDRSEGRPDLAATSRHSTSLCMSSTHCTAASYLRFPKNRWSAAGRGDGMGCADSRGCCDPAVRRCRGLLPPHGLRRCQWPGEWRHALRAPPSLSPRQLTSRRPHAQPQKPLHDAFFGALLGLRIAAGRQDGLRDAARHRPAVQPTLSFSPSAAGAAPVEVQQGLGQQRAADLPQALGSGLAGAVAPRSLSEIAVCCNSWRRCRSSVVVDEPWSSSVGRRSSWVVGNRS